MEKLWEESLRLCEIAEDRKLLKKKIEIYYDIDKKR